MNIQKDLDLFQCVVCLDPEISKQQIVQHPCGQDPICMNCFHQYFYTMIDGAFHGTCPQITCPVCPQKQFLPYDFWTSHCYSLVAKYVSLAQSLLSLQCGSCHTRRTLLIDYEPSDSSSLPSNLQKIINPDHSSNNFRLNLDLFLFGKIPVNTFYEMIINEYFPSIAHCTDIDAWSIFKTILSMIPNPERRANLHLRYLRARPTAYLVCCNREQCYRCKTTNTHVGRTCDEMERQLDNGFVRCSQCMIYLVKGDGCDTVTCVCGKQFSWSSEREKFDTSRAFQEFFPTNTTTMYARVLCELNGAELCARHIAEAWGLDHEQEAVFALTNWWKTTYAPYQSQCSILEHLTPTSGALKASFYWQQTHATEVQKCRSERDYARNSLIETYFPDYSVETLMHWFERDDFVGTSFRESRLGRLSPLDRSFLQQSIEKFRIRYHQSQVESDGYVFGLSDLFSTSVNQSHPEKPVSEDTLRMYLTGAQQFLALYGHLHAELGHLEIKLIPSELPQGRNSRKKSKYQQSFRNAERNRVLGSGPVLCRWSYSKSANNRERPYHSGVVTHYRKGLFDVTFTDGSNVEHTLGGLIFRRTLDSESSLYLPKYRHCVDRGESYPYWKPYFFPAIPMNQEHDRLYDLFCNCLRNSSKLYQSTSVQNELKDFTDHTRIYRAILPISKLLDGTVYQPDSSSSSSFSSSADASKNNNFQFEPDWEEVKRKNKKEKRKQMEEYRKSEKMTWRDVFRGVMWKAMRENHSRDRKS